MKKVIGALLILSFMGPFNFKAMAANFTEEETTQKDLGKAEEKAYRKTEEIKEGKKYQTKVSVSALQGYDNNVFLDSRRKNDTFSEGIFDAGVTYPLNGRFDVFGDISVHDITYWEATDASLVDTDFKVGFNGKLPADISFTLLNNVEVVEYPHYGDGDYIGDKTGLTIKKKLPGNYFHTFGYEYFYKNYSDQKSHNGWGGRTETDRIDYRNTYNYEFGVYLKKAMVKLSSEYFVNDSNDKYRDYYDYQSLKIGPSMIYLLSSKLSAYLAANKQYKAYESRTIPTNADRTVREKDHGYTLVGSLYYDVYKNTTLSLSYAYRHNHSNYAAQKYSGSITTMGLHCKF